MPSWTFNTYEKQYQEVKRNYSGQKKPKKKKNKQKRSLSCHSTVLSNCWIQLDSEVEKSTRNCHYVKVSLLYFYFNSTQANISFIKIYSSKSKKEYVFENSE